MCFSPYTSFVFRFVEISNSYRCWPGKQNWVVFCQGKVEGGFRGRTNKLVDGCYSFWQVLPSVSRCFLGGDCIYCDKLRGLPGELLLTRYLLIVIESRLFDQEKFCHFLIK